MTDSAQSNSEPQERYTMGYGSTAQNLMESRDIQSHAAFFIPYLKSGMDVLDCGCGPGTISAGIAALVAPGRLTGIDLSEEHLDRARTLAQESQLSNTEFRTGSIYELPFPDETFDAVFSHALFEHLERPKDALKEIQRVLKLGGFVGLRSPAGVLRFPEVEIIEESRSLVQQLFKANGGNQTIGRGFRGILNDAGFVEVEASASYESHGTTETVKARAEHFAQLWTNPPMHDRAIELGLATPEHLIELASAWREWGLRKDAFIAHSWGEGVGRKPTD